MCHKILHINCPTRNAHALYKWLDKIVYQVPQEKTSYRTVGFLKYNTNDVTWLRLFQRIYKQKITAIYIPVYVVMSARRRRSPSEERSDPKRVRAPELKFNSLVEGINPAFDPERVLLRRVFFFCQDGNKYVSVAFYPTRNYQPLVVIGEADKSPIILTDQHVRTMAEHLSRLYDALCRDEYSICRDGDFRMNSEGGYRVARV
jgi:hypothetical protein